MGSGEKRFSRLSRTRDRAGVGRAWELTERGEGGARQHAEECRRPGSLEGVAPRHGDRIQGHDCGIRRVHGPLCGDRRRHLFGHSRMDRACAQLVLHERARHHALCLLLPDVQPLRAHQAGRRRQQAGVQHLLLVRDAVLGRRRHRAALLQHRRAGVLFRQHDALGLPQQSVRRPGRRQRDERRPARFSRCVSLTSTGDSTAGQST